MYVYKYFKVEIQMKELIESKWDDILSLLETEYDISNILIDTWIRTLKIYEVRDNTVYFYVDEQYGENGVKFIKRKEFDFFLLSSIRETLNDSTIQIEINEKKAYAGMTENPSVQKKESSDAYKEAVSRSNLNPRYTFDTFIVGDSNRHAHATCLAVADLPGQDNFNPLFLYGNSGLGKTHLMQSIAHYILQKNENTNVLYVPAETFIIEIIDAIKNHTTNVFRDKYRKVDVLLIDDVQSLINKESTQTEFFNTFNDLYNNNKQIILSSDRPPKELKSLDERIKSRFECGVPIDIHEPDYETRMAILHNKAELDHLTNIPEEVFNYIAENVTNNVRELEGALNRLRVFSLTGDEITLDMAITALKDVVNKDNMIVNNPDHIVDIVSDYTHISADDIRSSKRSQEIATARQIAMYAIRKNTSLGLQATGDILGGRNHATVISGIEKIESMMKEDPSFANYIDTLMKKLKPST